MFKLSIGKNLHFLLRTDYHGIWLKIQLMIFSLKFKDHYCIKLRCSHSQNIVNFSVIVESFCMMLVFFMFFKNPKLPFVFLQQNTKFYSCTQTDIRFSQRSTKFRIVPNRSFNLWLRNTKFLKFLRNSILLFDSK